MFLQEHKREPTVSELASLCGVPEEEIVSALEVSTGVVSLSEPRQDGTLCLEDILGADNIAALVENVSLRQAVSRLPKDEKELIYYRYYKNYPQTQVAELLGRRAGQGLAHREKDYGRAAPRARLEQRRRRKRWRREAEAAGKEKCPRLSLQPAPVGRLRSAGMGKCIAV